MILCVRACVRVAAYIRILITFSHATKSFRLINSRRQRASRKRYISNRAKLLAPKHGGEELDKRAFIIDRTANTDSYQDQSAGS